jgi:SET domain-containing protein
MGDDRPSKRQKLSLEDHATITIYVGKSEPQFNRTDFYEIKESSVPGIGKGVFATKNIKKERVISYYQGVLINTEQLKEIEDCTYILMIDQDAYVDATEEKYGNWTRYINHPPKNVEPNLRFGSFGKVSTLRDIKKGEEFFISYGEDYWSDKQHLLQ